MFFRNLKVQTKSSLFTLGSLVIAAALVLSACSPQAAATTEAPAAPPATTAPTMAPTEGLPATGSVQVIVTSDPTYGDILTDSSGMTLYAWMNDTTPGKSSCNGNCATNWPPLVVSAGSQPAAGDGVAGLGTITRDDGATQVTVNNMPLYYFLGDKAAGDTNGQGVGDTWYLVNPAGEMVLPGADSSSAQSTPEPTKDTSGGSGYMDDYSDDNSMETPQATNTGGMGEDLPTSVTVTDQEVTAGAVTVDVAFDEPGWMVIHADNAGSPGAVIGFAPLMPGMAKQQLVIPIDVTQATPTVFAMLHEDEGIVGVYEFPGEDKPRSENGTMFTVPFGLTIANPKANTPAVVTADHPANGSQVTVPLVISVGAGWMVIHADEGGKPGPVLGQAPVKDGLNINVAVTLSQAPTTGTKLHAMLHTDAGTAGTYEFPGADAPVMVGDMIVMKPFMVAAAGTTGSNGDDDGTSDQGSGDNGSSGSGSGSDVMVSVIDMKFDDDTLTVKAGTTVTWTNNGDLPHTVTADDGSFDSATLASGGSFSFTFTQPGTYLYYCKLHGGPGRVGMSGAVIVTP